MVAFRFLGWVTIALAGCGKVGFDAMPDAAVDAAPDAVPDAQLPLCDRVANAIYCNDFEGGGLKGARNQGAVFLAGGGWNASGGFVVTADPGEMPFLAFDLPTPITTGELHIGGRLFLAPGAQAGDYVVVAQTLSSTFEKFSFDINRSDRLQLVNTLGGSGGVQGPADSFPRGRWACFEVVIAVAPAGGGGRGEVLIDGVSALAGFNNGVTQPATGFSRVEIGTLSSTMNTATEVITFDNWIISTQPIGCP